MVIILICFFDICINTIKIYLNNGYDVVFNYIIPLERLELLKDSFLNFDVHFIILMVDEKTLLKRDSYRPIDCQMGDRCLTLLHDFKNNEYNESNIIDTSNLTVNETIDYITKNIIDFKI